MEELGPPCMTSIIPYRLPTVPSSLTLPHNRLTLWILTFMQPTMVSHHVSKSNCKGRHEKCKQHVTWHTAVVAFGACVHLVKHGETRRGIIETVNENKINILMVAFSALSASAFRVQARRMHDKFGTAWRTWLHLQFWELQMAAAVNLIWSVATQLERQRHCLLGHARHGFWKNEETSDGLDTVLLLHRHAKWARHTITRLPFTTLHKCCDKRWYCKLWQAFPVVRTLLGQALRSARATVQIFLLWQHLYLQEIP